MTPEPTAVPEAVLTVIETTELATALVTASQSGAVPVEETVLVVEPVATDIGAEAVGEPEEPA
ncbi:hypothetical protein HMPREF0058_2062 [Actinomyces urogenitalis DSM 15434]|uniref:Uncharacterized protein n=1 Tax=Actinomyces urogenitalis DSM 15434 TaxID=525246 RepID=C0W868_9ACTO|nr:hypothetical protein HMPREF0058_2062 [Actinomyces urogenitalis DSM 15434]